MSESVLLVEDDELTREMLGLLLEADGWCVHAVESGEAALAAAADGRFDVALCDLNLPGICGAALAEALRGAGHTSALLGMTATANEEQVRGYDHVLLKPVDAAAVRAALAGNTVHDVVVAAADLDEVVYAKMTASMGASAGEFYRFAVADVEARVEPLKALMDAGDDAGFRHAAHAIKGSCAMMGAAILAGSAAAMEREGIKPDTGREIDGFKVALERLKLILAQCDAR